MVNSSSLRQLAKDYYEGRLVRSSYVERRRELIESLAAGGQPHFETSQGATEKGLFQTTGEAQPDSTDLVNAFANRGNDFATAEDTVLDGTAFDPNITAPGNGVGSDATSKLPEPEEGSGETGSGAQAPKDETNASSSGGALLTVTLVLTLVIVAAWYYWQSH